MRFNDGDVKCPGAEKERGEVQERMGSIEVGGHKECSDLRRAHKPATNNDPSLRLGRRRCSDGERQTLRRGGITVLMNW